MFRNQVEENSRTHAQDALQAVVEWLRIRGVSAEGRAILGNPAEEIVRVSEDEGCGLIAMSTHGRNLIGRSILGSVTDRVLHSASVPVLTITPDRARMYQEEGTTLNTVVVPLDRVRTCRAGPALRRGAGRRPLPGGAARPGGPGPTTWPSHTKSSPAGYPTSPVTWRGRPPGTWKRSPKVSGTEDWPSGTGVLRGAPAPSLLDLARETPRNLIAMTTHGRSGLTRWVMGSVAEAMIRGSGDPVLVVRPRDQELSQPVYSPAPT